MPEIKGVVAAILTPFDDNDKIDLDFVKKHVRWLEERGAQGIVPSGTNGECSSMTVEERKPLIETAVANKGRMFAIAGVGTTNLAETLGLARFAESVGSDAIMVMPPYYLRFAPEQGHVEYFKRVMDAISLPVFLYNIPGCTGIRITEGMIDALSGYPHLAGVKDSSGNLPNTLGYIKSYPNLKIFVGDDHHSLAALTAGAAGHITGMPNAFPEFTTALYSAFAAGEDASVHQVRLGLARDCTSPFPEFGVNKYVLSLRGFPLRRSRLPLLDMTNEQKAAFEKLIRAHGLWII